MNRKKQEEWITLTDNLLAKIETLSNKVAEQAAVIEKLIPAIRFDSLNMSLAERRDVCKVAEVARTDSKQILADWMRGQLGEPFGTAWKWDDGVLYDSHPQCGWNITTNLHIHPSNKELITTIPLYKKPECLK